MTIDDQVAERLRRDFPEHLIDWIRVPSEGLFALIVGIREEPENRYVVCSLYFDDLIKLPPKGIWEVISGALKAAVALLAGDRGRVPSRELDEAILRGLGIKPS